MWVIETKDRVSSVDQWYPFRYKEWGTTQTGIPYLNYSENNSGILVLITSIYFAKTSFLSLGIFWIYSSISFALIFIGVKI